MRVTLNFELPDALNTELQVAAETSGMTASSWAAQVIEGELAVRRLDYIAPGRTGAQFGTER